MGLLLSNLSLYDLPSAAGLMSLSCCVSAAAPKTIVFHSNSVLCLLERETHFFPSKDIPIEIFAKYLGSLIINFILRINHDDILGPSFKKNLTDDLRVAGVNKNEFQIGDGLFLRK